MSLLGKLLETPAVYNTWQRPFAAQKFAPVARHLAAAKVRRVLDVGCGPGTNAGYFSASEYIGLDINASYLDAARSRYPGRFIQIDLTSATIPPIGRFDTVLVNSFLHHLPDDAVHRVLNNTRDLLDPDGRVHILELVLPDRPSVSTIMARLDRGRYARPLSDWRRLFVAHFEPLVVEPYHFGCGLWSMVYFQGRVR